MASSILQGNVPFNASVYTRKEVDECIEEHSHYIVSPAGTTYIRPMDDGTGTIDRTITVEKVMTMTCATDERTILQGKDGEEVVWEWSAPEDYAGYTVNFVGPFTSSSGETVYVPSDSSVFDGFNPEAFYAKLWMSIRPVIGPDSLIVDAGTEIGEVEFSPTGIPVATHYVRFPSASTYDFPDNIPTDEYVEILANEAGDGQPHPTIAVKSDGAGSFSMYYGYDSEHPILVNLQGTPLSIVYRDYQSVLVAYPGEAPRITEREVGQSSQVHYKNFPQWFTFSEEGLFIGHGVYEASGGVAGRYYDDSEAEVISDSRTIATLKDLSDITATTFAGEPPIDIVKSENTVTVLHHASGVNPGNYGDTAGSRTVDFGDRIQSVYQHVDATGHINSISTSDIVLPSNASKLWVGDESNDMYVKDAINEIREEIGGGGSGGSIIQRLDAVEGRLDSNDRDIEDIHGRLDAVDGRLDVVEDRLDSNDERLEKIDTVVDDLSNDVHSELDDLSNDLATHEHSYIVNGNTRVQANDNGTASILDYSDHTPWLEVPSSFKFNNKSVAESGKVEFIGPYQFDFLESTPYWIPKGQDPNTFNVNDHSVNPPHLYLRGGLQFDTPPESICIQGGVDIYSISGYPDDITVTRSDPGSYSGGDISVYQGPVGKTIATDDQLSDEVSRLENLISTHTHSFLKNGNTYVSAGEDGKAFVGSFSSPSTERPIVVFHSGCSVTMGENTKTWDTDVVVDFNNPTVIDTTTFSQPIYYVDIDGTRYGYVFFDETLGLLLIGTEASPFDYVLGLDLSSPVVSIVNDPSVSLTTYTGSITASIGDIKQVATVDQIDDLSNDINEVIGTKVVELEGRIDDLSNDVYSVIDDLSNDVYSAIDDLSNDVSLRAMDDNVVHKTGPLVNGQMIVSDISQVITEDSGHVPLVMSGPNGQAPIIFEQYDLAYSDTKTRGTGLWLGTAGGYVDPTTGWADFVDSAVNFYIHKSGPRPSTTEAGFSYRVGQNDWYDIWLPEKTGVIVVTDDGTLPEPSDDNPKMDGLVSPGTSTKSSRSDHVHPSDTTRVPVDKSATDLTYLTYRAYPYDPERIPSREWHFDKGERIFVGRTKISGQGDLDVFGCFEAKKPASMIYEGDRFDWSNQALVDEFWLKLDVPGGYAASYNASVGELVWYKGEYYECMKSCSLDRVVDYGDSQVPSNIEILLSTVFDKLGNLSEYTKDHIEDIYQSKLTVANNKAILSYYDAQNPGRMSISFPEGFKVYGQNDSGEVLLYSAPAGGETIVFRNDYITGEYDGTTYVLRVPVDYTFVDMETLFRDGVWFVGESSGYGDNVFPVAIGHQYTDYVGVQLVFYAHVFGNNVVIEPDFGQRFSIPAGSQITGSMNGTFVSKRIATIDDIEALPKDHIVSQNGNVTARAQDDGIATVTAPAPAYAVTFNEGFKLTDYDHVNTVYEAPEGGETITFVGPYPLNGSSIPSYSDVAGRGARYFYAPDTCQIVAGLPVISDSTFIIVSDWPYRTNGVPLASLTYFYNSQYYPAGNINNYGGGNVVLALDTYYTIGTSSIAEVSSETVRKISAEGHTHESIEVSYVKSNVRRHADIVLTYDDTTQMTEHPMFRSYEISGSTYSKHRREYLAFSSDVPVAGTSIPYMDSGSGSAGSSANYSKADHVHPQDRTKLFVKDFDGHEHEQIVSPDRNSDLKIGNDGVPFAYSDAQESISAVSRMYFDDRGDPVIATGSLEFPANNSSSYTLSEWNDGIDKAYGAPDEYNESVDYELDAHVRYNNRSYRCIVATKAGIAPTNTLYWKDMGTVEIQAVANVALGPQIVLANNAPCTLTYFGGYSDEKDYKVTSSNEYINGSGLAVLGSQIVWFGVKANLETGAMLSLFNDTSTGITYSTRTVTRKVERPVAFLDQIQQSTVTSVNGVSGAVHLDATNLYMDSNDQVTIADAISQSVGSVVSVNEIGPDPSTGNIWLYASDIGMGYESNDISISEAISGKQDALTFDSEPTKDSTNPVTSGGVYNALDTIYIHGISAEDGMASISFDSNDVPVFTKVAGLGTTEVVFKDGYSVSYNGISYSASGADDVRKFSASSTILPIGLYVYVFWLQEGASIGPDFDPFDGDESNDYGVDWYFWNTYNPGDDLSNAAPAYFSYKNGPSYDVSGWNTETPALVLRTGTSSGADPEIRRYPGTIVFPVMTGATSSTAVPMMDSGSGEPGDSLNYSRSNHVHPSDTSRVAQGSYNKMVILDDGSVSIVPYIYTYSSNNGISSSGETIATAIPSGSEYGGVYIKLSADGEIGSSLSEISSDILIYYNDPIVGSTSPVEPHRLYYGRINLNRVSTGNYSISLVESIEFGQDANGTDFSLTQAFSYLNAGNASLQYPLSASDSFVIDIGSLVWTSGGSNPNTTIDIPSEKILATTEYVDDAIGDINSVLDAINGEAI